MVNQQKLIEFVKNNAQLILSEKDNSGIIKEAKKKFFVLNLNKRFGTAKDSEVAREAAFLLIKVKKITNLEDLKNKLKSIPYLRKNIHGIASFELALYQGSNSILKKSLATLL